MQGALLPGAPGRCVLGADSTHTQPHRPPGKSDPAFPPSLSRPCPPQGTEPSQAGDRPGAKPPPAGIHPRLLLRARCSPTRLPGLAPDQVPKPLLSQKTPLGSKGCWQGGDLSSIAHSHLGTAPQPTPSPDQVGEKAVGAGNP